MKNRPAIAGETLVMAVIGDHGAHALVNPKNPVLPVCLEPGTQLLIRDVPESDAKMLDIAPGNHHATFVVDNFVPEAYRDSFLLGESDQAYTLYGFGAGIKFDVLSVPGDASDPAFDPDMDALRYNAELLTVIGEQPEPARPSNSLRPLFDDDPDGPEDGEPVPERELEDA